MVRKVRYVAGSGCILLYPVAGRVEFYQGIEYEIPEYSDFLKLTKTGKFEEVVEETTKKKGEK